MYLSVKYDGLSWLPVIVFLKTLSVSLVNIVIITETLETETAVTSNDDDGIMNIVLDTHFIHERVEFSVDITTDNYFINIIEVVYKYILVFCLFHLFISNIG